MAGRLACVVLLVCAGCALLRQPDPDAPLGSRENPIRSESRPKELQYLGRLRCPDDTAPHFRHHMTRIRGPYGTLMDEYTVRCVFLNREVRLWFDHHHAGFDESKAPEGFRLSDRLPWSLRRRSSGAPLP